VGQNLYVVHQLGQESGGEIHHSEQIQGLQILGEEKPTTNYLIDDASVINKTTRKAVNDRLKRLDFETGYRVTAITVRKLEVEADAFAFTDRIIEGWCVNFSYSSVSSLLGA
jgi:hypothetical protein